jgi:hypothetical protein
MKKHIIILGFAVFAAVMFPACEGPAGPQGIQGERGEIGEKGEKGAKGETGEKGEPGQQGEKGETGEKGDSLYLVIFNANSGAFSDGNETKKVSAEGNSPIAVPEEPYMAWGGFLGWYTRQEGGSLFDFTTPVNVAITLYAHWLFDKNLLADWLEDQSGGDSEDDPLILPISINLDEWRDLLGTIESAQKYVGLDLSRCDMNGTVFNPDSRVSDGKNKIVSIILPNKATGIAVGNSEATSAFAGFVNLRSFSGANLAAIGAYAFYKCAKLNPDALPASVTSIGNYSFYNCTEMELTELPSGIVSIGSHAFDGCSKLALTELPAALTIINSYSFRGCKNLALIELPPGITEIGTYAFNGCVNLALTELPLTVKIIRTNVFNGCSSLTQMTVYEKITNIGSNTFSGCSNLEFFTCLAETPPTLGTSVFYKTPPEFKIKVPEASIEAYKKAANWSSVADKIIKID